MAGKSTDIGNLNTVITASGGTQFVNTFDTAGNSLEKYSKKTKLLEKSTKDLDKELGRSSTTLKKNTTSTETNTSAKKKAAAAADILRKKQGKMTRGLLELSRGAEDAAVSWGTGGLAGAFRGAGNNLSQAASIMGPMAGTIVGLSVAAGAILSSAFNKAGDAASGFADELARLRGEADKLKDRKVSDIQFKHRREDLNREARETGKVTGIDAAIKENKRQHKIEQAKIDAAVTQRENAVAAGARKLGVAGTRSLGKKQLETRPAAFADIASDPEGKGPRAHKRIRETKVGEEAIRRGGLVAAQVSSRLPDSKDKKLLDDEVKDAEEKRLAAVVQQGRLKRQEKLLVADRKKASAEAAVEKKRLAGLDSDLAGLPPADADAAARRGDKPRGFPTDEPFRPPPGDVTAKPLTEQQRLSKLLRVANLRKTLSPQVKKFGKFSPNTAAIGRRGAFEGIGAAVRDLAKANAESKQDKRDSLQEDIKNIQQKQLDVLEKELVDLGIVNLN